MNQLNNLKQISIISTNTGNIKCIKKYYIQFTTINPSIILKSLSYIDYSNLFEDSIKYSKKQGGNQNNYINNTSNKLLINIDTKILKNISGTISIKIDPRLSFNTDSIIQQVYKLIQIYQENNIAPSRLLIKITTTWASIKAEKELVKSNIKYNLTLLFSSTQECSYTENNVYLISPFVSHIYDWYNQHNFTAQHCIDNISIKTLKKIFYYYKINHYDIIIIRDGFHNIIKILVLTKCNYLTISPNLLKKLSNCIKSVRRYLSLSHITQCKKPTPLLSKKDLLLEYNTNKIANENLQEGIQKFLKIKKI